MLREMTKAVVLMAASAVTMPYAIAVMANILYGWPQGPNRYKRALHPSKVIALNYSVLQKLHYLRFTKLYFKWKKFYREAMVMRLLKDIPYGCHENKLDLYFPQQTADSMKASLPQPVVVFIYGGAWGSGDKSMYGLLGCQIADNLNAIVCIPNYSTFPRGYVDDMVQDVVDCLSWVHTNIERYGGDRECIMIIGHSAGAHLAVMATIELTLKRLMHNPQAIIRGDGDITPPPASLTSSFQFSSTSQQYPGGSTPLSLSLPHPQPGNSAVESIRFEDRHFDKSSQSSSEPGDTGLPVTPPRMHGVGPESASTTGSFFFVSEADKERRLSASGGSDSFFLVKSGNNGVDQANGNGDHVSGNGDHGSGTKSEDNSETPPEVLDVSTEASETSKDSDKTENGEQPESGGVQQSTVVQDDDQTELKTLVEPKQNTTDSAATGPQVPAPSTPRAKSPMELVIEDDDMMTRSQRAVRDLLQSIRCLIGLAGVYDIVDHFEHEASRGIEDLSPMGKAMYGPEHFHRFSPTQILATLPHRTRFPPVLLVHGDVDFVVPVSSTERFSAAMADMGSQAVEYHVPGCPHYDICLDLMDPQRTYHDVIMGVLRQSAQTYCK